MKPCQSPMPTNSAFQAVAELAHHFPFLAYAKELSRLANAVEENSKTGRVDLQTLSQLAAMEEITRLIRSAGLATVFAMPASTQGSESKPQNRIGYI